MSSPAMHGRVLALLIGLPLALLAISWLTPLGDLLRSPEGAALRAWLASHPGAVLPVAFLLFVLCAATGVSRALPVLVVAGLLGTWSSLVLAVAGSTAGAWLSYGLARRAGRRIALRRAGGAAGPWLNRLRANGFLVVLGLRLLPGTNGAVTSTMAGMAGVARFAFLSATALGILPSTLAYVGLGAGLVEGSRWHIVGAMLILAGLSLAAVLSRGGRAGRKVSDAGRGRG